METIKTLQDVRDYIKMHKWFISNCSTNKATLEYYQRVYNKIYNDLNLLVDKGVLK